MKISENYYIEHMNCIEPQYLALAEEFVQLMLDTLDWKRKDEELNMQKVIALWLKINEYHCEYMPNRENNGIEMPDGDHISPAYLEDLIQNDSDIEDTGRHKANVKFESKNIMNDTLANYIVDSDVSAEVRKKMELTWQDVKRIVENADDWTLLRTAEAHRWSEEEYYTEVLRRYERENPLL